MVTDLPSETIPINFSYLQGAMPRIKLNPFSLFSFLFLQIAFLSCNSSANEQSTIETELTNFSTALAKADTSTLRNLCSPDFVLIDEGKTYDLQQLFAFIKIVLDSNTMTRKPVDPKITVRDNAAWAYYSVTGELRTKTQTIPLSLLESVVLDKADGVWKIVQVTTMPTGSK